MLTPDGDTDQQPLTQQKFPSVTNHFCGSPLDRVAHKRKDSEWINQKFEHKKSKLILFMNLNAVVVPKPDLSVTNKLEQYRLFTVNWEDLRSLDSEKPFAIFLGSEEKKQTFMADVSTEEQNIPWFAVDVSKLTIEDIQKLHPHAEVVNAFPALMQLSDKDAAISGQARSMLAWHDRYDYHLYMSCPYFEHVNCTLNIYSTLNVKLDTKIIMTKLPSFVKGISFVQLVVLQQKLASLDGKEYAQKKTVAVIKVSGILIKLYVYDK